MTVASGLEIDIGTMQRPIAERIVNVEKLIDIRNHGRTRQDDECVVDHYQWQEKTDGTRLSMEATEFRQLLGHSCTDRGWDGHGVPPQTKLKELGIVPHAPVGS